jgi:HlyD family secretion protein
MWRMLCALSLTGIFCALQPASAQQPPVDKEELKRLQADLEKARSQVRDLEARLKKIGGEDAKDPRPAFRLEKVVRGRIVATVSSTGTLQPREVVDVGAQVVGRILSLGKDSNTRSGSVDWGSEVEGPVLDKDGKLVKPGTVLAQIDPTLYEAARNTAQASLKAARADVLVKAATLNQATRDWGRAEKLLPSGGISQADYDQYKATFESAKANLELSKAHVEVAEANLKTAQANLAYTTITAPTSGVVIDRRVNIGQTVAAGLTAPSLFLIAKDLSQMEIWATVNEVDVAKIHADQEVTFTVDAFPGRVFHGKVVPQGKLPFRLNAVMNQNVVTYTVVVSVDNNDGRLRPYLTTNLTFIVADKKDALLVPNAALRWQPTRQQITPDQRDSYFKLKEKKRLPTEADAQDQGFLWMQGTDGLAHYTQVRTGVSDGARTEISSAIGDGEVMEKTQVIVGEGRVEGNRAAPKPLFDTLPTYQLVIPTAAPPGGMLTPDDAAAIARECPAVRSVAPVVRARIKVTFGDKSWVPLFIYGTTPSFLDVREWLDLDKGASFTDADVRNAARVCLIGQTIKRELFGDQSPVGREIRLGDVTFKVVGILSSRGANAMGLDQDDLVLAPWTTIKARVSGQSTKVNQGTTGNSLSPSYPGSSDSVYPTIDPLRPLDSPQQTRLTNLDQIIVRARTAKDIPLAIRQITDLLRQRHHIKPGQPDDFSIRDMTELIKALKAKEESPDPSR